MENGGGGGDGSAAPPPAVRSASRKHELVPQPQLDPGYHFVPTDEELVDFHLRGKIEGREPPLHFINEVDIMRHDPEKLIEKYKVMERTGENRWYFFTVREPSKTKKKGEPNRKVVVDGVEEGSWSATGSVVQIHGTKETDQDTIIGTKRVLTYRSVHSSEKDKWSMHEYVMAGKSQIGQYVLCAIQLKQTYESEEKARKEQNSGNKRKRKAARKREMQLTCQAQDEQQHETPPPEEETTGDPDQFIDIAPSMNLMFGGVDQDTPHMPNLFAPCNDDDILQRQALQLQNPNSAMLFSNKMEPLRIKADQLMITPCCIGNCISYQQAENDNVAFGETDLNQQHDRALENTGAYPDNILVDGNADCSQRFTSLQPSHDVEQRQALQLQNPNSAMLFSNQMEPLHDNADQLMTTPCYNGNFISCQQAENVNVAFGEADLNQQHDRTLGNTGAYPDNILIDGNMADYSQRFTSLQPSHDVEQRQALQLRNPNSAMLFSNQMEPLHDNADQLMTTPCYNGNFISCQQAENVNVAFGEADLNQQHDKTLGNTGAYPDNILVDGNMADYSQRFTSLQPSYDVEQRQALQLQNPNSAMLFSNQMEPLHDNADQLMTTPCCNGNFISCQQAKNVSVAFGEADLNQQHDRALGNTGVYSDNILVDDNMADYSQRQIYNNQDNDSVLIKGSEDTATFFPGNFMMSEQMAAGSGGVSGCDHAVDQSMAVQHNVADTRTIDDFISSFLNGNVDGDSVG